MTMAMDEAALTAFLRDQFPQVADDFAIERTDGEALVVRLAVSDKHLRPGGTVSGPTMFALADVAIYLAILARIGPVALAVTTNCSIDFMRKPRNGADLRATARLLKLGRVLAVGDVLLHSDGLADPVARASLTYSIPADRPAVR
ncbi:putative thioesterase superfamily protein [Oceaniovalibus guishaninsula JLT2003]|uniref:Putative thioesterase superfamily protein n=1 Tax=Oceaniovalibus guishaninsula JLT2003 TaxID=1231392 RepID=K2HFF4_9RHOB|nr:PaaI family thioesterase [Oceaniovalibus guishaninsula]EKE45202.1 putative thioesterase superfamily protein [Oceaniovalibus guishaninsula JLT2003]